MVIAEGHFAIIRTAKASSTTLVIDSLRPAQNTEEPGSCGKQNFCHFRSHIYLFQTMLIALKGTY